MTNKTEKIAELKTLYPVIKIGSEETGYTELNSTDYQARISEWADNLLARELAEAEMQAAKNTATDKLAAIGLTADDIAALIK